ncbi:transcriptional activator xlnR [Metarhizium brunneum]
MEDSVTDVYIYLVEDYGYVCRYNREIKKRGRLPASTSVKFQSESQRPVPPTGTPEDGRASQSSPPSASPAGESAVADRQPLSLSSQADQRGGSPASNIPPIVDGRLVSHAESVISHGNESPERRRRVSTSMSVTSLIQPGSHKNATSDSRAFRPRAGSLSAAFSDNHVADSEALISDDSVGYPSPANLGRPHEYRRTQDHRDSFRSAASNGDSTRESFSTATVPNSLSPDLLQKAPTEDCCYRFLDPVLPYIRNILPASVACELLDIFLTDPGSSLFRGASPYILTRIFRRKSILHPTSPRHTTPALLATILWCVAQTADVMLLHVPGTRAKVVNDLYDLAISLVSERDPDRWRRIHGGLRAEKEVPIPGWANSASVPTTTAANEPAGGVDDVLTFILLSIAVSGGDFKSDCYKWWSKALRLTLSLQLNREDERCPASVSPCANPLCSCHRDRSDATFAEFERREERRRVFWLLYSLDRHLSLSFNTVLSMPDSYCEVYAPLPERIWENLDAIPPRELPTRVMGPPVLATGTGYLEYFLPLMAILGDIIEIHHRRRHPRLGQQDDAYSISVVQHLLTDYEFSLGALGRDAAIVPASTAFQIPGQGGRDLLSGMPAPGFKMSSSSSYQADQSKVRLVMAYSTHILHVLHVLLHGKWDAISMLDGGDDWITSEHFTECASHAISASQSVSTILTIDPELTFMSYLFGIYLLQGSFILLLFADRMPQLGPNESVEQACENIIRAHEVCVVTLNTEFQKNFRKVVRSTLYSVRGTGTTDWEEHRARRRALSLYRWTKGAKGLAL